MNTYEQIVRELAEGFSLCDDDRCHWCRASITHGGIQHKPDCLIVRARQATETQPLIEKEITVSEKKEVATEDGFGAWVEETPLYLYSDGSVRWQK